jgi:ligand-binding SRPBCC domain-containing protein
MTVLENSVRIQAPPEKVWSVLGTLDALDQYDPGVSKSAILTGPSSGVGASRQCDLKPGGWFRERVTEWQPNETLAFELVECTLPIRRLTHRYTLTPTGDGTVVQQRMEYTLKFGPLGWLMDAIMVRRTWDAGVKGFFAGLKGQVEKGSSSS